MRFNYLGSYKKTSPKIFGIGLKILGSIWLSGLFFIPAFSFPRSSSSLIRDNPKEVIDEVWQIVYRDYLDSTGDYSKDNWILIRKEFLKVKYNDSLDSYDAIREMLSSLNDPYTRFLDPIEFNQMRIDTTGELMGVGIQISLDKETNNIVVVSPIEGTPAFKAGIKPKDVIVSIDDVLTKGMSIDNAVKMIRGKKGTHVKLGLLRGNNLIKVSLTRDRIGINAIHSQLNKTNKGVEIAYIRLKQFNANAAKEMSETIKKFESKNVFGYVLDLRGNPGGLLEASVEIARQWIDKGTIVSTKTKDGINDIRRANGTSLSSRPVVLLVNEGSASASEILSGAIKDNNRGLLVGNKTFGKGLVQSVRSLSDGSGLTVTIAKYLTPKGIDINKFGINPDIFAPLSIENARKLRKIDLGTSKDSQYVIAESQLLRSYLSLKGEIYKEESFNPLTTNINYALRN